MATLDALRKEIRNRAERIVRGGNIQLEAELKRTAPVGKTKRLQKGITVRLKNVGDIIESEAVVDVEYAEPVIKGAKAHPITAPAGKFLAFDWPTDPRVETPKRKIRKLPDGRVLLEHVNHPGNDPNPFWENGLNRWGLLLQQMADRLR